MFNIGNLFGGPDKDLKKAIAAKEEAARILKTSPEALDAFLGAYKKGVLNDDRLPENPMDLNAKQAAKLHKSMAKKAQLAGGQDTKGAKGAKSTKNTGNAENAGSMGNAWESELDAMAASCGLVVRIINELAAQTPVYVYDGEQAYVKEQPMLTDGGDVTKAEIMALPEEMRPQLTGNLMKKDLNGEAYPILLEMYQKSRTAKKEKERRQAYNMFRQGLDIQDLDPVMYEILGQNRNSMGHWLPPLVETARKQDFFKIPKTTLIQVPMTLLQLTRLDYMSMTPATMHVVNGYCKKVFSLDTSKDYFIRTGTHSSKFDFRNAHVHGEKEVEELGEYLLYNHYSGNMMAGPLCRPCIYGMATTREWCVREYIEDKDEPKNPEIYKGLPLRTEIRAFVDMDADKVLGIAPYWDPETMKKRFGHEPDADSPHQIHDYIVYSMHQERLMRRYEKWKDRIKKELEKMIPDIRLTGQWSIDIMLNGTDQEGKEEFWIIDMALARDSALKEYVPEGLLDEEGLDGQEWIPDTLGGSRLLEAAAEAAAVEEAELEKLAEKTEAAGAPEAPETLEAARLER